MNLIPPDIKDYLSYNPDTGKVVWSKRTSNRTNVGAEAGTAHPNGYIRVHFKGKPYYTQRLAWFLYYGEDPCEQQVDHINGDPSDNRLTNLRLVNHQQNGQNRKVHGVHLNKGRWRAKLKVGGRDIHIGYYDCPLMAGLAYQAVKSVLHPLCDTHRSWRSL